MEEKKIAIIGAGNIGKTVLSQAIEPQAIEHRLDAVIVMPARDSFTVKERRYTKRPEKPIKGGFGNMMIRQYAEQYFRHEFTYSDNSFIIEQYRLIQDKKCNLSKSKRDKIEKEFNRRFEIIKEAE